MLKFKTDLDRTLFLAEIQRMDLISAEVIPDELFEVFVKRRQLVRDKMKNFRKSQNTKMDWRRNRYKRLKGIRKWHSSTQGKRFHRNLSRFLITRIRRENFENFELADRFEILKGISSLKTHLYIEGEYFRSSLDEDVEFEELLSYSIPLLNSVEEKLLNSDLMNISNDEFELIFRLVDESELQSMLSDIINISTDELDQKLLNTDFNEDLTYGLLLKYSYCVGNELLHDKLVVLVEDNDET